MGIDSDRKAIRISTLRGIIPKFRSAPVFGRDLHVKAIGIDQIDGRYSIICLKSSPRFGIRQFAVNFIRQAFCRIGIDMVDCHGEMRDHALFSATESTLIYPTGKSGWIPVPAFVAGQPFVTAGMLSKCYQNRWPRPVETAHAPTSPR